SSLTKNGRGPEIDPCSESTANERLVSVNSQRAQIRFGKHAKAAAKSREAAKGVMNRSTSSRLKRDCSLSSSASDRPRGRSVITKSPDLSQTTSRMFKK